MKRLVTDNPQDNILILMNLAYVKDKEVWIRGGGEDGEDCNLNDMVNIICKSCRTCKFYDDMPTDLETTDQISEGIMECSMCGCPIGTMYFVAVQAAELRERLRMYEAKDGDLE